jgi:hypothetical protein
MDKIDIAKGVIKFVASIAVSAVMDNAIKMNTPENLSTVNKGLTMIGGALISGMVASKSTDYVMHQLDGIGNKNTPA